jgi:hypothetical protein
LIAGNLAQVLIVTLEQERGFEAYGCVSRCLLFLAHRCGNAMSADQFIEDFAPSYPQWPATNRWGLADHGMALDIARRLGVASPMSMYRGCETVQKSISMGSTNILLFTEKKLENDGSLSDFFHCSVVVPEIIPNQFQILHPTPKITQVAPELLSFSEVDQRLGLFLILN